MNTISEKLLSVISLALNPKSFALERFETIKTASLSFFEDVVYNTNNLRLNAIAVERTTGYSNLVISFTCLLCAFVLLFVRPRSFHNFMSKFLMQIFYILLSFGGLLGFIVHGLELEETVKEGLWYALYVLLIITLLARFIQTFWECGKITCIFMIPFLLLGAYIDVIACWKFDKFILIGLYAMAFGIFMGLGHMLFVCSRTPRYILYFFADLIALASVVIQTTSIQYGDWNKNGFFHIGVALYIVFNTIALIICVNETPKVKTD